MKNNAGKCYIILSSEGFYKYPSWRECLIENFYCKKSLGINIVCNLNFYDHQGYLQEGKGEIETPYPS